MEREEWSKGIKNGSCKWQNLLTNLMYSETGRASTWMHPDNHFFCTWCGAEVGVSWLWWSQLMSWQNQRQCFVLRSLLSLSWLDLKGFLTAACGHQGLPVSCPSCPGLKSVWGPSVWSIWTGWMFVETCDDKAECQPSTLWPQGYFPQHGERLLYCHWVSMGGWSELKASGFHWRPNMPGCDCRQFSVAQSNFLHFVVCSRTCSSSWSGLETEHQQEILLLSCLSDKKTVTLVFRGQVMWPLDDCNLISLWLCNLYDHHNQSCMTGHNWS